MESWGSPAIRINSTCLKGVTDIPYLFNVSPTKSSIGWYKKLPRKESQKEILPLNYQTCMDKFDISSIVCVRVPNCSPNCTGVLCKTTPQTSRLAGSCQEVCCQTISTLYLMKSKQVTGGRLAGLHTLTDRKKTRCVCRRRRKENTLKLRRDLMNKTWGIVPLYSRSFITKQSQQIDSLHKLYHCAWSMDWELSIMYQILNFLKKFTATLTLSKTMTMMTFRHVTQNPTAASTVLSALIDMPS